MGEIKSSNVYLEQDKNLAAGVDLKYILASQFSRDFFFNCVFLKISLYIFNKNCIYKVYNMMIWYTYTW